MRLLYATHWKRQGTTSTIDGDIMARVLNQFSIVPVALFLIGVLFWLLKGQGSRVKQVISVLLLAVSISGYFFLRPGEHHLDGASADSLLRNPERPVLVEIYSNY
jgi:hypothetical protein